MKKWVIILLCLLSLLFLWVTGAGTAVNKALEEKIVALEKQGWEAIKKKDWTALGSLMTEDFVDVGEVGIRGRSAAIDDLKANLISRSMGWRRSKCSNSAKMRRW